MSILETNSISPGGKPSKDKRNIVVAVDPLDLPIWGAKNIAVAANLLNEKGEPDERKAFHLLQTGALPATKISDTWVSTPRRLRDRFNQIDTVRKRGRGRKPVGDK
jgi:hypothetical protein